MPTDSPRLRLSILAIVAVSLFSALFARLWYLQVVGTEEYRLAAEVQNTRQIAIESPRGRILDARGRVIVDNRVSIEVILDPRRLAEVDDPDEVLLRLAEELTNHGHPTKLADLQDQLADPQYNDVETRAVATDVNEDLEVVLTERNEDFPAVEVVRQAVRVYPYGKTAAHILGYVGRISAEELEEVAEADSEIGDPEKPYQPDDHIGKAGVERVYEGDLRGEPGVRTVEVDARGEPIRTISYEPPRPGHDLQLTIDLDVQALTEAALVRGLEESRARPPKGNNPSHQAPAGSIVVLDPRDGDVVGMASYPTYDPAEFVGGISTERYDELLGEEAADDPFTNRSIAGQYAPGSTFKLVTGYAGLKNGLIGANSWYSDSGSYTAQGCSGPAGCSYKNAGGAAYGSVNIERAITVSSDAFFYWLGDRFWIEDGVNRNGIQDAAEEFGFHQPTGVPLPFEQSGFIPTAERRQQRHDENPEAFPFAEWYSGDNIITAIGQGDVLSTPLQLANSYATFANGGTRYAPNVAARVLESGGDPADPEAVVREIEPVVAARLDLPAEEIWEPMRRGFLGVTSSGGGTARKAFDGWDHAGWPVGGKTGTAEVAGKADTAVFTAFGPAYDPQYVVTVVLEQSGFGGDAAAPVARWLLEPLAGFEPLPPARTAIDAAIDTEAAAACAAEEDDAEGLEGGTTTTSTTSTTIDNPLITVPCPEPVEGDAAEGEG